MAAKTSDPPPTADPPSPAETLNLILSHFLPLLLAAADSVEAFKGKWRTIHSKLSLLFSSLSDAAASPHWSDNALLVDLLPALLASLRSLHALSSRCLDRSLPHGRLQLQSDIDKATSTLSTHLDDLLHLLRSGLLHHPPQPLNAIVLLHPDASSSLEDLTFFIRDIFARLKIGALDLKHKALDSLLRLLSSDPAKLSAIVALDGGVCYLLRLLSDAHSLVRDRAAAAVSVLCVSSHASCKAVFDEGGLGPLLRLLHSGSAAAKERAAAAVEAITADPSCGWAVNAYHGVPVLVDACRPGGGPPAARALAARALRNVSTVDGVVESMVEEGAVHVLVDLLSTGTSEGQENAALCLSALVTLTSDAVRDSVVDKVGIKKLPQLLHAATDPAVIEQMLRFIQALSASPAAAKALSASLGFFIQLEDLVTHGGVAIQLIAASLLSRLSPSQGIKSIIGGCLGALVKMLNSSKPALAQEAAAGALVSLLEARSNRKELGGDEKSLMRLIQMLDPKRDDICKTFVVSVVVALLAGGGKCKKKMAEAGASHHLQKLADADVPGAKKALQRINGGGRLKNLFSVSWRERFNH